MSRGPVVSPRRRSRTWRAHHARPAVPVVTPASLSNSAAPSDTTRMMPAQLSSLPCPPPLWVTSMLLLAIGHGYRRARGGHGAFCGRCSQVCGGGGGCGRCTCVDCRGRAGPGRFHQDIAAMSIAFAETRRSVQLEADAAAFKAASVTTVAAAPAVRPRPSSRAEGLWRRRRPAIRRP